MIYWLNVKRVLLNNVALIRIEQLYPFPVIELKEALQRYKNAKEVVWVQEEPRNQGTWYSMQHHMNDAITEQQTLSCVSRLAAAAPAGGYMSTHLQRQKKVVADALKLNDEK